MAVKPKQALPAKGPGTDNTGRCQRDHGPWNKGAES